MNDFGAGRVIQTRHTVTSGGAELDKYTFEWDRDGNKTRRVDAHTTGVPGMVDDYTHAYDGLSRMTARTPDSGAADTFTYDATGNRTTTGYAMEGADALVHAYTKTPADSRGYDRLGNVATYNARERWYTFDAESRLTSLTEAGSRINDVFAIPGTYSVKSGTWSVTDSVLTESTSTTGRILRALPTGTTDIAFSYKSPHDAEDTTDYDPERYGLFIVRLFETGWKYAALVIEPTGPYLREWDDDTLVAERDSESAAFQADTWYDVKVAYSGTDKRDVSVYWAKRGDPMPTTTTFTGTLSTDLAEAANQKTGFGTGQIGEYSFRDVQLRDPSSTVDTVTSTYIYDAMGRRIGKTIDPGGTPITTQYIYDGDQLIEERDGSGAVIASYVYGPGIDEPIAMTRGGSTYYYHQDDQHNVVALTDNTGAVAERYTYGAFGAPSIFASDGTTPRTTSIASNAFLFTGREWDPELGSYWYRTRYYDPKAGRFLSRDTIGLWGDASNLGNPYTYTNNNPWSKLDPFGEQNAADIDAITDPNSRRDPARIRRNQAEGAFIQTDAITRDTAVTIGEYGAQEIILLPATIGTGGEVNAVTSRSFTGTLSGAWTWVKQAPGRAWKWMWETAPTTSKTRRVLPAMASTFEDAKGILWKVGRHGDMPNPRPEDLQSHHGIVSVWMQANFEKYDALEAPAILMPREPNHTATFGVFNRWRAEIARRQGVNIRSIDYSKYPPAKPGALSCEPLKAALWGR
jgi:RHS repeat-associated protein